MVRTCSPHIIPSSASPGTALLTPEREQRRPDIQVTHKYFFFFLCNVFSFVDFRKFP